MSRHEFLLTAILMLAIMLSMAQTIVIEASDSIKFILYSVPKCESCVKFKEILKHLGIKFEERDISTNPNYLSEYRAIIRILNLSEGLVPLAILLKDSEVLSIAYGIGDRAGDELVVKSMIEGKLLRIIITPSGTRTLSDVDVEGIQGILRYGVSQYLPKRLSVTHLLTLTASLALSDSINPCTIYLYIVLLAASAIATWSRGSTSTHVARVGSAFILAVALGYSLLGIGLLKVLWLVPKYILAIVGIAFGLWVVLSAAMGVSKGVGREYMFKLIPRAAESAAMSFILGFLASVTLLPCSAGPYIVFLGIISTIPIILAIPILTTYLSLIHI